MTKENLMKHLYGEIVVGDTAECRKAIDVLCESLTITEHNKKAELLIDAVDAECEQAFTAGFNTALTLMGGVQ